jgi:hypothetical protein
MNTMMQATQQGFGAYKGARRKAVRISKFETHPAAAGESGMQAILFFDLLALFQILADGGNRPSATRVAAHRRIDSQR